VNKVDILGNISKEQFLKEYWQKKPLLIRQAYPNFEPLIPADELAGMSLEEEIESRIIMESGPDSHWQPLTGPFTEETFSTLPEDKWTLLIQGVDQWVPEAADLLQDFNFIPNWRIDDLMISFATDGGSVGPHYDQYDVFLLQAEGQREWRVGQVCSLEDKCLEGTPLRILAEFEESDRWVLEPGDMLYLPPCLAHYGISQGNCQTYSIGFRAPTKTELMHSLIDQIAANCDDDSRYQDPDLKLQEHCGEISESALQQVRDFMTQALADPVLLGDTIGKLMTEAKYPQEHPQERDDGEQENKASYQLSDLKFDLQSIDIQRELHSRFAFNSHQDNHSFYAGGKAHPITEDSLELAKYLTQQRQYNGRQLQTLCENRDNEKLLLSLWQEGHFFSGE